jgi:hypothetical protein
MNESDPCSPSSANARSPTNQAGNGSLVSLHPENLQGDGQEILLEHPESGNPSNQPTGLGRASISSTPSEQSAVLSASSPKPIVRRSCIQKLREWHGEFVACFIFVGFLVATVFTLRPLDGKTLPKYSVNTLLSLYGVMIGGSTVYVVGTAFTQSQWRWFTQERRLYDVAQYDEAVESRLAPSSGSFPTSLILGLDGKS